MKKMKTNVVKLRSIFATQIRSICTISIAAIIGFSMTACLTEGEKAASARDDYLKNNSYEMSMLTKPPAADETVIGTYTGSYTDSKSGTMGYGDGAYYKNKPYMGLGTKFHPPINFVPQRAVFQLLAKAKKQFPDIDVNELSVRSVEMTSRMPYFSMSVNDKPISDPKHVPDSLNGYTYTAYSEYPFKGVVVRLPEEKR